jgi:hypothetical protein
MTSPPDSRMALVSWEPRPPVAPVTVDLVSIYMVVFAVLNGGKLAYDGSLF